MSRILLILALTLFASSLGVGQTVEQGKKESDGQDKAVIEILRLEAELKDAGRRGDAPAINRLMANEAIATFPDGRVDGETKKNTLSLFQSGQDFGATVENKNDEVKVLIFGETAVVNGRQTSSGKYQGQDVEGQVRYTHVWARLKRRWQLVASQWTLIAPKVEQ